MGVVEWDCYANFPVIRGATDPVRAPPLTPGRRNAHFVLGADADYRSPGKPNRICAIMITTRRNSGRMAFFLLLLSGHFATAQLLSGVAEETSLDCTNDLREMFCQFKAQNCSENSLIIQNIEEKYDCPLQQCDGELCCCSVKNLIIVFGQTYTARVWRKNQTLESKLIDIIASFKPQTPTIQSVNESNGNFELRWTTNMDDITSESMTAEVTYYKKGTTKKVSKQITPAKNNEVHSYEINGQNLVAGTTYVVFVRTFTKINNKYSDSSKEWEFKTPSFFSTVLLWVTISLGVCAVIFSVSLNSCYIKLKKWCDQLPRPKVAISHSVNPLILVPESNIITFPKYKLEDFTHKTRTHVTPLIFQEKHDPDPSVSQTVPAQDISSSGSSSVFNQTYSLIVPRLCDRRKTGDDSSSQRQNETLSVPAESSNKSGIMTDQDHHTCLLSEKSCTLLSPTKTLCQRYNAECLKEAASSSSEHSSSDSSRELKNVVVNEPPSEGPACPTETILNIGKPSFGTVPPGSHGFLPMDDNYQPFRCQGEGIGLKSGVTDRSSDILKYLNEGSETFVFTMPRFIPEGNEGQFLKVHII